MRLGYGVIMQRGRNVLKSNEAIVCFMVLVAYVYVRPALVYHCRRTGQSLACSNN